MHGTTLTRLVRLSAYLCTHPQRIPQYVKTSLFDGHTPIDLGLPWIAFPAIDFLDATVRSSHLVGEFGGGGSTVFFAERAKHVHCIESSETWASRIINELTKRGLTNVNVEVQPFDPSDFDSFVNSQYVHAIGSKQFDVILIDGYEESVALRPHCFWTAERCIREGGIIVVDDSWRYPQIRSRNRAVGWKEFRGTGPCRPGVTTTDVYFY